MRVVLIGVSGCGKTTVGRAVAQQLNLRFVDGDDYHPKSNVEKMRTGHALNDQDRTPWLVSLSAALRDGDIVACSALKQRYRQLLDPASFIHLDAPIGVVRERVAQRTHQFMPCTLLESQYKTLEQLQNPGGYVVDASRSLNDVVADVLRIVRAIQQQENER